ncbi:hypothetical protein F2Q70_00011812 [Brassica cretica]|uniref:Retrotransposon gag domain-containing protein n=1 Tax=Brassica cretica TaxID=69181 RepID=A0A8S9LUH5_BRACR|nr:hypothetical protein F2Q70_00011812 [Brassica cretica]
MQSIVERLPGVAPPIRKSNPDSYADTPFAYQITLIEMPMKFSFPSIKEYDGPSDSDDHVTQYMQRMLAVALPKESREAIMCKGFGSILTGPALQWYINLPSRSISSFAILSDKFVEQFASSRDLEKTYDEKVAITGCNIPTAIFAFKRGLLPDGDLYKELTKYQCKSMVDVLSRAWAQVKWEEDVASRAKAQLKQDPKAVRPDRSERDERPSPRPTREQNSQADALANLGSALEMNSRMSIPLLVLQCPATLEEPQSEEISAIEEDETWMTPLVRYLENDILPEDRKEARKIKKQAARYCISQARRRQDLQQESKNQDFKQGDWVLRRVEKATGKVAPGWEGLYKLSQHILDRSSRSKRIKKNGSRNQTSSPTRQMGELGRSYRLTRQMGELD